MEIWYVGDNQVPACYVYRVESISESMAYAGLKTQIFSTIPSALTRLQNSTRPPNAIVIHRKPWDIHAQNLIVRAHKAEVKIGFDVDDLVFEASEIPFVRGYYGLTPGERQQYERGVLGYREMMIRVDFVTVSTHSLACYASRYCANVFVVPNMINRRRWKERYSPKNPSRKVSIGYFSGTRSHEKDVAMVEHVLMNLLQKHGELSVHLGGLVSVDPQFEAHDRVLRHAMGPFSKLPGLVRNADINICPLERSPFCDAKSNAKYLEACLAGIPSVVSDSPAYECVTDSQTGLRARTSNEWMKKLELLVENPSLRRNLTDNSIKLIKQDFLTTSDGARKFLDPVIEFVSWR